MTTETTLNVASKEAEEYALGGMLNSAEDSEYGLERLEDKDFYYEENRKIFKLLQLVKKRGESISICSLQESADEGLRDHLLYLYQISCGADVEHYIKSIKDHSAKRRLLETQREMINDIQKGKSIHDILEGHKQKLELIDQNIEVDSKFSIKNIAEINLKWFDEPPLPKEMLMEYTDKKGKKQGFIPKGNVCMLVGMGGIGKSHWVSQLAVSIASDTLFLDMFTPSHQCKTGNVFLGLAENDLNDIHRLLFKSSKHLFTQPEPTRPIHELKRNLTNHIFPKTFHGEQCQFILDGKPSPYFYELKRHLIKHAPKNGWTLLVFDPISRFLGAEAETDNAIATTFIALMEQLSMELPGNPTILLCHHVNKTAIAGAGDSQAASRGSSAITDGVRLQINLSKPSDTDAKELGFGEDASELTLMTMTKSNFTRIIDKLLLKKDFEGNLNKHPKYQSTNSKSTFG